MFNLFKPKQKNQNLIQLDWSLDGMHCTSCAVNIDLTLEDLEGVTESNTNFARSIVSVKYDPARIDEDVIKKEIEKLGYSILPAI